jgi:hypothetical protein
VRRFLLETSILERLSGPLCDAVTGRSDSQDLLEELERANPFLIPLDEERRWYRFHHLFRDLLGAELQRAEATRLPELHRRAAVWSEQHRLIDETIRHALAAGDAAWATRLVEEHLGETLHRGESVILDRWLSWLPDEVVRSRPPLCLAQAMLEWHRYRLDAVERLLQHVERALEARPELGSLRCPPRAEWWPTFARRSRCCVLRSQGSGVMASGRPSSHERRWHTWPSGSEVLASGPGGCRWPPTGTVVGCSRPDLAPPAGLGVAGEQAVSATTARRQLTRELHDSITSAIVLIGIQAGLADQMLDQGESGRAWAREALGTIRAMSRQVLEELQATVATLRGSLGANGPPPGVDQLDALTSQAAGAGLGVERRVEGVARRTVVRAGERGVSSCPAWRA